MVTILTTVAVIGVLIFIHEMGHFMAARAIGVGVHEFSLGFGPVLAKWKRGMTQYSIRIIPLGGFVRLAGMHPHEEDNEEAEPVEEGQALIDRSVKERMFVFGAGSGMNFILAAVIFTMIFAFMGQSEATLVVDSVAPDLPAEEAGVQPGDRIVALDGHAPASWMDMVEIVQGSKGQMIEIEVQRNGEIRSFQLEPASHPEDPSLGAIGVHPVVEHHSLGLLQSAAEGFRMTGLVIVGLIQGIIMLIRGGSDFQVISIVGIGQEIGTATRMGVFNLLFLTAGLSVSVGFTNLLPIPALDGSRLVFLGVEAVRGRPVDPDRENFIHFVGFAFIMLLTVFIIYRDIARLGG